MTVKEIYETVRADESGKFARFSGLLLEENERTNLTSITDPREIDIKHFCDSLALESFFPHGSTVLEVGSGGGFPSVPLKIFRDDLSFVLVESNERKCRYLQETVDKLSLSGMKVVCKRAEVLGRDPEYREKFDVCCARAVAKMSPLAELCLPFVKVGGVFVAYRGADEDVADAAVKALGGETSEIFRYSLPAGMGERAGAIVSKVSPTPDRFPRSGGAIAKRPL